VLALGAHSDSVYAGPGINDDGSGSIGILEVAEQLSAHSTNNAVRFGWWSGEEFGLLGSEYYVSTLSASEAAKIRLYLNFDMIASPNYYYAIYDGDGSDYNITGPPGSAEAEHFFEVRPSSSLQHCWRTVLMFKQDFYDSLGLNHTSTEFDGRSDYGPFLDANIASGGLFTGAEVEKTESDVEQWGGMLVSVVVRRRGLS
jgi:Zn-dependent M28 family amino/carboxypeptidase